MSDRKSIIEQVRRELKIPRPDLCYKVTQGIGPSDPDFFVRHNERRRMREEAVLAEIEEMSDEEIEDLTSDPRIVQRLGAKHELDESPPWYSGGFSVEGFEPDWDHWRLMNFWTLHEATCLSLGFDPGQLEFPGWKFEAGSTLETYGRRKDIVARSQSLQNYDDPVLNPKSFAEWARDNNLACPKPMLDLFESNTTVRVIPAMLQTVDVRRYNSALKVIIGLLGYLYGEDLGENSASVRKDIHDGLAKVGLSIDPKTLRTTLGKVSEAKKRLQEEPDSAK